MADIVKPPRDYRPFGRKPIVIAPMKGKKNSKDRAFFNPKDYPSVDDDERYSGVEALVSGSAFKKINLKGKRRSTNVEYYNREKAESPLAWGAKNPLKASYEGWKSIFSGAAKALRSTPDLKKLGLTAPSAASVKTPDPSSRAFADMVRREQEAMSATTGYSGRPKHFPSNMGPLREAQSIVSPGRGLDYSAATGFTNSLQSKKFPSIPKAGRITNSPEAFASRKPGASLPQEKGEVKYAPGAGPRQAEIEAGFAANQLSVKKRIAQAQQQSIIQQRNAGAQTPRAGAQGTGLGGRLPSAEEIRDNPINMPVLRTRAVRAASTTGGIGSDAVAARDQGGSPKIKSILSGNYRNEERRKAIETAGFTSAPREGRLKRGGTPSVIAGLFEGKGTRDYTLGTKNPNPRRQVSGYDAVPTSTNPGKIPYGNPRIMADRSRPAKANPAVEKAAAQASAAARTTGFGAAIPTSTKTKVTNVSVPTYKGGPGRKGPGRKARQGDEVKGGVYGTTKFAKAAGQGAQTSYKSPAYKPYTGTFSANIKTGTALGQYKGGAGNVPAAVGKPATKSPIPTKNLAKAVDTQTGSFANYGGAKQAVSLGAGTTGPDDVSATDKAARLAATKQYYQTKLSGYQPPPGVQTAVAQVPAAVAAPPRFTFPIPSVAVRVATRDANLGVPGKTTGKSSSTPSSKSYNKGTAGVAKSVGGGGYGVSASRKARDNMTTGQKARLIGSSRPKRFLSGSPGWAQYGGGGKGGTSFKGGGKSWLGGKTSVGVSAKKKGIGTKGGWSSK